MDLEESCWAGRELGTPALPADAFGLAFALVADERRDVACVLRASYRLPGEYAQRYGGRIDAAIALVAVDRLTGTVHAGDLEGVPGAPPLFVATPPEGGSGPVSIEGERNVALVEHLGLAPGRGFDVFLWCDEFVSRLESLDVPSLAAPEGARPFVFAETEGRDTGAPRGELELARVGERFEGGAWLPGRATGPLPLTLLCLHRSSRALAWRATTVPPRESASAEWSFSVALDAVRPRASGTHFALAVAGGLRADALAFEVS